MLLKQDERKQRDEGRTANLGATTPRLRAGWTCMLDRTGRLDGTTWVFDDVDERRRGAVRHPDKWAGGAASPAVTIPIPLPRV